MSIKRTKENTKDKDKNQKLNQHQVKTRDTSRSDKIIQKYRQSTFKAKRLVQRFKGTFETAVQDIFPLLCPAREADWIPGWDCELIYTDSGYAEKDCIFRTDKSNSAGEGLWIFTGFEVNNYIDLVRIQENIVTVPLLLSYPC